MTAPRLAATVAAILLTLSGAAPATRAGPPAPPLSPFDLIVSLESNPLGDDLRMARYEEILQHFSDTAYEATEGAHWIGTVRIFTNGTAHDRADVVWQRRGHPKASLNGIRGPGHLYMVDTFTGGGLNGEDLSLVDDPDDPDGPGPEAAGTVLAHEWAHYAYGLLDEHVVQSGDTPVAPSLMNSPWTAEGDESWREFSIAGAGTGPFENTGATEQHRRYQVSAWELLPIDPGASVASLLTAAIPGAVERTFFEDLVPAAPDGAPETQGPAPDVTVTWVRERCSSYVIAIDNSGSMTGRGLSLAKGVAGVLVDFFAPDVTSLSVMSFSDVAIPRLGPALVGDDDLNPGGGETQRDLFHDAINQIAALPRVTSFNAGLAAALPLFGTCDADKTSQALFFISDGTNGPMDDFGAELSLFADAEIPIYVLDVSVFDPDATSNEMTPLVAETGGILVGPTAGFTQAVQAFRAADLPTRMVHDLEADSITLSPGDSADFTFTVDSSLDRFSVCASSGGPVDLPRIESISLVSPSNIGFPAITLRESELPGDDCSFYWAIENTADFGVWRITATADNKATEDVQVTFDAQGQSSDASFALRASISNASGAFIQAPEPIHVTATLGRELPIVGARIDASLDGGSPVRLRDDGIPPDAVAGDGQYVGSLIYELDDQDVSHTILVTANSLGIAALSSQGLVLAPNIEGNPIPPEEDVPLDAFVRFAELPVTTSGMAPDTDLDDTTAVNGRIESGGGVDLFTVDLAAIALDNPGNLEVRVTGALLGMLPNLAVYDGDPAAPGTSLLGEARAASGTSGITVPVSASSGTVYAEVSHAEGGTGTYQISAGPVLGLSFGPPGLSGSPCDVALTDKDDALTALEGGLSGVPAAMVLIDASRDLERTMIAGIGNLSNATGQLKKARKFLKRAVRRDDRALKRLRKAEDQGRSKKLKGARKKIRGARRKLEKACQRLSDGGTSLIP